MASRTVLVVDDDASIRLLCRVNLELEGNHVFDAASLGAARAVLDAEKVDVVLLDVHVGAEDGLAFLAELRARRPSLPVAMLTGSAEVDELRDARPDAVIEKPFTLEALAETVARIGAGASGDGR